MSGRHDSRAAVHWRAEVVAASGINFPHVNGHPHLQIEIAPIGGFHLAQSIDCGIRGGNDGGEGRQHPVPGVLEHPAAGVVDGLGEDLVVAGKCRTHGNGSGFPQLGGSSDVGKQEGDVLGDRVPNRQQVWIVVEDPQFELLELCGGIDAELFAQVVLGALVGPERLGLTAIPVQGHHQLGLEAFPQRVLEGQCRQLPDEHLVAAQRQVGVDTSFNGG